MTRTLLTTLFALLLAVMLHSPGWTQATSQELLERYQATDLTANPMDQMKFYQNPWKYQGQQVYFSGIYKQHLNANQAVLIVGLWKAVIVNTTQDLTEWPFSLLGCVGEVIGTAPLTQGFFTGEVPLLQIQECAPRLDSYVHNDRQQHDAVRPEISKPEREKMSDTMEQLLEEARVPNLQSSPTAPPSQQPLPSSSKSIDPVQPEIDQQIAKLSIPKVAPVESIKEQSQRIDTQPNSNQGQSTSPASSNKNQYLAMVEERIDHEWRALPLGTNPPGVTLKFHIARSGEISNILTDESSGNELYDAAAYRAVTSVNPLPPFSPGIPDPFFKVRFRFIKKD